MTVGRLVDTFGGTLLRPVVVASEDAEVEGVVIADPIDEQQWPVAAVVLGVGFSATAPLADLIEQAARRGARMLILREPVDPDPAVGQACQRHRITLAGLTRGASWVQLAVLLRSMLAEGDVSAVEGDTIGGLPAGDLFGLANAIAELIDAPITIEDRSSRVLAFSGRQDEADPSRIETILERQVPERYAALLQERGFFEQLYASDQPVHIRLEGEESVSKLRVAVAVRAGSDVLGSVWAAVPEQLSPERVQALADAAKLVALHLLRVRAGADASRRIRADLLSTALAGGQRAPHALSRLGLDRSPVAVLAVRLIEGAAPTDPSGLSAFALQRQRLTDAFATQLSIVHPRAAAALIGDTTYGLLPVPEEDARAERARRTAVDFLARTGPRLPAIIGIGSPARDAEALAGARRGADKALRVLAERDRRPSPAAQARQVALYSEVQVESLLLDLRDQMATEQEGPMGPVARLHAHDREAQTAFGHTLAVWLESMGEVSEAASVLHIHPNTLRYRLRRIEAICGLDLSDPAARFAAQLQLRLFPPVRSA